MGYFEGEWPTPRLLRLDFAPMSLDPRLLDVLACPEDKGPLTFDENHQVLINPRLGIAYRIDDDIPVLLRDEATPWPPSAS